MTKNSIPLVILIISKVAYCFLLIESEKVRHECRINSIPNSAVDFFHEINAIGTSNINVYASQIFISQSSQIFDVENMNVVFKNGFISGAVINAAKNLILHPLETIKARLDVGNRDLLFKDVYSGIVPSLVGGVPAAAIFFGTKDILRNILRQFDVNPEIATLLAVTLAQIPYWILRNPSEVLKTRMRTNTNNDNPSFNDIIRNSNIQDLYSGMASNLLYALPSDWIKFIAYEILLIYIFHIGENSPVNGGIAILCGSLAALISETLCTPLDVVRTRIMCEENNCIVDDEGSVVYNDKIPDKNMSKPTSNNQYENSSSNNNNNKEKDINPITMTFNVIRDEGMTSLFAGGIPRSARALLDGAVQFAAYEMTQNLLLHRGAL